MLLLLLLLLLMRLEDLEMLVEATGSLSSWQFGEHWRGEHCRDGHQGFSGHTGISHMIHLSITIIFLHIYLKMKILPQTLLNSILLAILFQLIPLGLGAATDFSAVESLSSRPLSHILLPGLNHVKSNCQERRDLKCRFAYWLAVNPQRTRLWWCFYRALNIWWVCSALRWNWARLWE